MNYETDILLAIVVYVILEIMPNRYWQLIRDWPNYIAKPLGRCIECTTGQVSLWFYVACIILGKYTFTDLYMIAINIIFTIFVSMSIQKLLK